MPGRDGTGPMAMGPMTGGGRGFCMVNYSPGIMCAGLGRRGRSGARGRRNITGMSPWITAGSTANGNQDIEVLKTQVASLEKTLEQVRRSLSDLENKE